MNMKEIPLGERPRERMKLLGKEVLSTGELLAILLGSGTREKTALKLADELLAKTGGLTEIQGMTLEEAAQIPGIGEAKAARILAAAELGKRLSRSTRTNVKTLCSSEAAAGYVMDSMRYLGKEEFRVLLVDTKGAFLGEETVSVGDLAHSIVHPRESFRNAIRRGAYGVIFAHNHPSGDPTPSRDDIDTTKRLCKAGELLGIHVLDHIIIGDGQYTSLRKEGIIE